MLFMMMNLLWVVMSKLRATPVLAEYSEHWLKNEFADRIVSGLP
jgi:hypothetical protein